MLQIMPVSAFLSLYEEEGKRGYPPSLDQKEEIWFPMKDGVSNSVGKVRRREERKFPRMGTWNHGGTS